MTVKEVVYDVAASMIASFACVYTGQPFDTVKVRVQVYSGSNSGGLSIINCVSNTVRNEGITALWRGSVPAFIGALSENAVAFATNGVLKRIFHAHDECERSATESVVIGGVTGFFSAFALCPSDVVKCRAQANIARGIGHQTTHELFKKILREQGVRGLYVGIEAQIIRDVPFFACFFGCYDVLGRYLRKTTDLNDLTVSFISGGFAGQLGWVMSIAQDTIKSRIQTSSSPINIRAAVRDILQTKGSRGLFAGVEAALIRAFPSNAALFVAYEMSRKIFANAA